MLLMETNNTDQAYCHNMLRYNVVGSTIITTAAGDVQGGSVPSCPVPTIALDCRGDALPRSKRGDLRGRNRQKTDPNHRRIPTALHPGALTVLGGGPEILPGLISHSGRRPQH